MSQTSKFKRSHASCKFNMEILPGLDCSGENHVLPPSFQGIKALVARLGGDVDLAAAAYQFKPTLDDDPHQIVADFVDELQFCDKVERVNLLREFGDYIHQLGNRKPEEAKDGTQDPNSSIDPSASGDPSPSGDPVPPVAE